MIQTTQNTLLAPFEIWEVALDHSTIKFHQPLVLTPNWMPHDPDEPEEIEYLEVEEPKLNISSCGQNREELLLSIHDDIRTMWKVFVRCSDSCLDAQTQSIKQNYISLAEEISDECTTSTYY
jgi:hypothetical protein